MTRNRNRRIFEKLIVTGIVMAISLACSVTATTATKELPTKEKRIPAPESSPTAEPLQEKTSLPITETPEPQPEKSFARLQFGADNTAKITGLWISAAGEVWVGTTEGLYVYQDKKWSQALDRGIDALLGDDASGRLWVIQQNGSVISGYRDGVWVTYGQGEGWDPLPEPAYLSPGLGEEISTDADGRLWLATGMDDLRSFDPVTGRWERFTASQIGFPLFLEKDYQGYFLTDTAISGTGGVWVSACVGIGETLKGRGVTRQANDRWVVFPQTLGDCVFDIEVDGRGVGWIGTYEKLRVYNPFTGSWKEVKLPYFSRRQLVKRINLDMDSNPWVEVLRFGGSSPYGSLSLQYYDGEQWAMVYEMPDLQPAQLGFLTGGRVLIGSGGNLQVWQEGRLEPFSSFDGVITWIKGDRQGNGWVTVGDGADAGLWLIRP